MGHATCLLLRGKEQHGLSVFPCRYLLKVARDRGQFRMLRLLQAALGKVEEEVERAAQDEEQAAAHAWRKEKERQKRERKEERREEAQQEVQEEKVGGVNLLTVGWLPTRCWIRPAPDNKRRRVS